MGAGPEDPDEALDYDVEADVWPFPSERFLQRVGPGRAPGAERLDGVHRLVARPGP